MKTKNGLNRKENQMATDKETITLSAGGKSVTLDREKFDEAVESFPIQTAATVKSVKITKEGGEIQLVGCNLSGDQYKKLSRYVAEEESVRVYIVPLQGTLFEEKSGE
jgi:hypothetical protein